MAIVQGLGAFKGLALAQDGIRVRPGYSTTALTTGMTKGDLFMAFSGSKPRLGICWSTASQGVKYIRLKTKTFARQTA